MTGDRGSGERPSGPLFWAGVVVGWSIIGFGIAGALGIPEDTHPRSLAIWIAGSLLVHDLVAAPIAFGVAWALRRTVPRRLRVPLVGALFATAVLVVLSVPVVGRFGLRADNPTLLPRDYTTGLLLTLAAVWTLTALVLIATTRRSRAPRPEA